MPELPEVEVVRKGLEEHICGATFRSVEVLHPRAVRGNDVDLTEILPGLSIDGVRRRGKYLWFELSDGYALVIHLRMSGQMLVGNHGEVQSSHLRIRADLGDVELAFVDQRTFGYWHYTAVDESGIPTTMAHVAPDPFEEAFDVVGTSRALRKKNSAVKTVLLDQGLVSGIGSIYADEAMWAAEIHPARKAKSLRQMDGVRLLEESRAVMARALKQGGTSFDSLYVNVNGASGYFARSLNAYGRADEPCARCGAPIQRIKVNGRSSYFCPNCQH